MSESAYARGERIIRYGKYIVKYVPVCSFFDMWFHVGLLLLGYDVKVADLVFALPPFYGIAFYAGCVAYGYCKLHRALVLYTILVTCCINYQQHFDFGSLLTPARWLVFLLGLAIFIWLAVNRFKIKNKN